MKKIIIMAMVVPSVAFGQEVQLQPQFYMQALQQHGVVCADENIRLRGIMIQYAAEVADLKKRLAEAEAKVPKDSQ